MSHFLPRSIYHFIWPYLPADYMRYFSPLFPPISNSKLNTTVHFPPHSLHTTNLKPHLHVHIRHTVYLKGYCNLRKNPHHCPFCLHRAYYYFIYRDRNGLDYIPDVNFVKSDIISKHQKHLFHF